MAAPARRHASDPWARDPSPEDWELVRRAYVEGDVTEHGDRTWPKVDDLSERYQVFSRHIRRRAEEHRWNEQRQRFRERLQAIHEEKRLQEMARDMAAVDQKAMAAAKIGVQLVQARLAEVVQELQRQQQARVRDPGFMSLLPAVDARELESLARAATGWHALAMKAGGTEVMRLEISGPNGGPVESRQVSVEAGRDDPRRLAEFLVAVERAQLPDFVIVGDDAGEAGEDDSMGGGAVALEAG